MQRSKQGVLVACGDSIIYLGIEVDDAIENAEKIDI
jgi:hypothetical protein